MKLLRILIICVHLASFVKTYNTSCGPLRKFPKDFMFGASSSAYQVEGAWNVDGKGVSIWDVASHTNPSPIEDGSNGDISADTYHHYKNDTKLMKQLGLQFYRFSISWTRILPSGFLNNNINQAGIDYYNNLINELIKNKITPMVTIYHWDLPINLQKLGGWTNPDIVNWYKDYANLLFKYFGDRVKYWITINEPIMICYGGYGIAQYAPFINIPGIADYKCVKNIHMAHASVYRLYEKYYRKPQNGKIGISLNIDWYEPLTNSKEDLEAALEYRQFRLGIYANPIFSKLGDFPKIVKMRVAAKSAEQGFPTSRLPNFTPQEVEFIRGTADFFGLNTYTSQVVYRNASVKGMYKVPSTDDDAGVAIQATDSVCQTSDSRMIVACGFYKLLMTIKKDYNNPIVYITENGMSTTGGLDDYNRICYIRCYLNSLLTAIEDGCNVKAYSVWSIMDNLEWSNGYTDKFGIIQVDFNSPERTRCLRKSAEFYQQVISTRKLEGASDHCMFGLGLHY